MGHTGNAVLLLGIFQIDIRNCLLGIQLGHMLSIIKIELLTLFVCYRINMDRAIYRRSAVMDPKAKKIFNKIENALEERKGRDRRKEETERQAKANANRRTGEERRDSAP